MKLKQKIETIADLAKIRFLGQKIPVAVRWNLTNKCPSRCTYCTLWKTPVSELKTEQIFRALDELAKMGTKTISYSGGEPLLRDDIGRIVSYTKKKGISPSMNSNGFGFTKRVKELRDLDLIKISLDGPAKVAALTRGRKEAYSWAIKAAETAKGAGIRFSFATTITRFNKDSLPYMANLAIKYGTMVAFQPLKTIYRGVKWNSKVYPSKSEWKKIMRVLRSLKRNYPENVRNSDLLISYIANWPNYEKLRCFAGKVFCIIDPNGDVLPCDRVDLPMGAKPNLVKMGSFRAAFEKMPVFSCSGCGFCGAMELNFLLNGKWRGLKEAGKLV